MQSVCNKKYRLEEYLYFTRLKQDIRNIFADDITTKLQLTHKMIFYRYALLFTYTIHTHQILSTLEYEVIK